MKTKAQKALAGRAASRWPTISEVEAFSYIALRLDQWAERIRRRDDVLMLDMKPTPHHASACERLADELRARIGAPSEARAASAPVSRPSHRGGTK